MKNIFQSKVLEQGIGLKFLWKIFFNQKYKNKVLASNFYENRSKSTYKLTSSEKKITSKSGIRWNEQAEFRKYRDDPFWSVWCLKVCQRVNTYQQPIPLSVCHTYRDNQDYLYSINWSVHGQPLSPSINLSVYQSVRPSTCIHIPYMRDRNDTTNALRID